MTSDRFQLDEEDREEIEASLEIATDPFDVLEDDRDIRTDGGNASSDTEWEFEEGEALVKEEASEPQMPGLGGTIETEKTEYVVTHRLVDADEGRRYYHLEWEEDAPEGSISDKNTRTMLYSASVVRMHYRSLETETERSEASR